MSTSRHEGGNGHLGGADGHGARTAEAPGEDGPGGDGQELSRTVEGDDAGPGLNRNGQNGEVAQDANSPGLKHCAKCGRRLPLTEEFWYRRNASKRKHWWGYWCRQCERVYSQMRKATAHERGMHYAAIYMDYEDWGHFQNYADEKGLSCAEAIREAVGLLVAREKTRERLRYVR